MIRAGSTSRVEASSMLINATGVVGGSLQDLACGRSMRSHCKEIHGVSILIPLETDISSGRQHHQISCLHHYGVEGTTACQGSSWIHRSSASSSIQAGWRRTWNSSNWIGWRWKGPYRIGELIKASERAHFSNTIQELKAVSTATTSSKYFQALTQAFDQAGYSLSTV